MKTIFRNLILIPCLLLPVISHGSDGNSKTYIFQQKDMDPQEQKDLILLTASALRAWNPKFETMFIERQLYARVEAMGLQEGLMAPLLSMLDMSYVMGRPQFAEAISPLINRLSQKMGRNLNRQLGLPMVFNDSISDLSRLPNRDLEDAFGQMLGARNYRDFDTGMPNIQDPNHAIDLMLSGPGSAFSHVKKGGKFLDSDQSASSPLSGRMGMANRGNRDGGYRANERNGAEPYEAREGRPSVVGHRDRNRGYSSNPGMGVLDSSASRPSGRRGRGYDSTPAPGREDGGGRVLGGRGPLTKRDITSYNTCIAQCADAVLDLALKAGTVGVATGGAAGGAIGTLGGPFGAAAGAAGGGFIGGGIGGVVGGVIGAYDCAQGPACKSEKSKPEPTREAPSKPAKDTDRPVKTPEPKERPARDQGDGEKPSKEKEEKAPASPKKEDSKGDEKSPNTGDQKQPKEDSKKEPKEEPKKAPKDNAPNEPKREKESEKDKKDKDSEKQSLKGGQFITVVPQGEFVVPRGGFKPPEKFNVDVIPPSFRDMN